MAKRGFELNTRITATDDASKVVDGVAKKVGELEDSKPVVDVDADGSKAESEIRTIDRRLGDLTDEDRTAILEVQARQAKRELDQVNRKLANAERYDDDEIRLLVEAKDNASKKLQAIDGELRQLKSSADDTGNSIKDKLSDALGGLGDKFQGIGGKLGGKLAGGFAAIGVGALMVEALQNSWERAGGIRRITGQFRLSAEEAARYGKEAGELYADNWGESVVELQQIVATVGERLEDVTGEALGRISEQIVAVSETWGVDYESVIRSITQLTQNDLAGSSQEALDLIVTGFQDGADEAGDFLDTIDEYSQHWEAMGLSGEDALNMIIAGFQGGQRDADKLADAVKEFRIRAVEDTDAITEAYETLGFNADETREKFLAGGDSARQAYLDVLTALRDVEDPIEQNRLAIELIGTQFEDLGPKALDALTTVEGKLRETEGAAADLAETVGEVSPWEELKREGQDALGTVGDALANYVGPPLRDLNDGIELAKTGFGLWGDEVVETNATVEESARLLKEMRDDAIQGLIDGSGDLRADFTRAMTAVEASIDDARTATDEKREADRRAKEEADRHRHAIRHLKDEYGALEREIDDEQAWLNLQKSMEATIAAMNDGEASARDQRLAILDLKEQVLDYAESINLPDRVVTDIIAQIDAGKVSEVEAFLARLGNGVTLPIKPVVIGGPNVQGQTVIIDENGNARIGRVDTRGTRHTGGTVQPGQTYSVLPGEVFTPNVPGRVHSRSDSQRMTEGAGSGDTFITRIDGNVYGVDHLHRILDERDRQLAQQIRQGRRA